jgi:hypothetical protein
MTHRQTILQAWKIISEDRRTFTNADLDDCAKFLEWRDRLPKDSFHSKGCDAEAKALTFLRKYYPSLPDQSWVMEKLEDVDFEAFAEESGKAAALLHMDKLCRNAIAGACYLAYYRAGAKYHPAF